MQRKACQQPIRLSASPSVSVLLIGQLIGSPASVESRDLFLPAPCTAIALLVVCRRRRPSECHANYKVRDGCRFCLQNWLPWQRPLRDRRNNFRSFIHSQRSTSPANFVKLGPVDVEMIGLTGITKMFLKTTAQHNPSSPVLRAQRVD